MSQDFVCIDDFGLLGSNFYWKHRDKIEGATETELAEVGLKDDKVLVHKGIIDALVEIDKEFQKHGYRIYIKEGYRPKELYEYVYKKRVELFGKERTDRLLNMKDMPHASGKSVDVSLVNVKDGTEIALRDRADGDNAFFINFYKDKTDEKSKKFQSLQDFVINTMQAHGFRLGTKREYFHFNYRPDEPKTY